MFFLYHRSSRPTGRVLAEALGAEHGEVLPGRDTRDVLVRWGARASGFYGTERTLNNVAALSKAADKFATLQILRDAGVRVPDFTRDPTELKYPFLGRKTQHARGTDIVLCMQRGDIERKPRDYFVQYVPTKREFRIHVVCGQVIRVQGKFLDRPADAVPWIRNHKHGYRFRAPQRQLNRTRLNAAKAAVAALGLDFGAVDLLIGDDNLEYVLEVNTAPACSPVTAKAYVEAFARNLNIQSPNLNMHALQQLAVNQEEIETETEAERI